MVEFLLGIDNLEIEKNIFYQFIYSNNKYLNILKFMLQTKKFTNI